MKNKNDIYPLTIVKDRYGGCYSGGRFTAWNYFFDQIPDEIDGDDPTCFHFWYNFKQGQLEGFCGKKIFCGFGATPDEAHEDLYKKITS